MANSTIARIHQIKNFVTANLSIDLLCLLVEVIKLQEKGNEIFKLYIFKKQDVIALSSRL